MKLFYCYLFVVWGCMDLFSQNQEKTQAIEEYIADIFEQYTSETEEDLNFELFYEQLLELSSQPVNLNNATRETLEMMPFLSDIQIENILYYIYKFGPVRTIYELQLIEGIDMTDIRYMLPFVTVGSQNKVTPPIRLDEVFKYGRNEVLCSFSKGLEKKAGYYGTENDSSCYRGNNLYNYFKYRFEYKDRVMLNFTAEKDAGEGGLKLNHNIYDYYSASVQIKGIGLIKNVIIGDYQAGFGQGIVIKQAFTSGKSSAATQILSVGNGFKSHRSTNEYNFLRGCALTIERRNVNLHFFYSNKPVDGNVHENSFSGFYQTGYHRTEAEFQKKNTIKQMLYGGNITLTRPSFQLGITSVFMQLDHELTLKEKPYNLFYFQGNKQLVTGINYRIKWNKFNLFGESAITNNSLSTINGVTFSPVPRVNAALLYRNYAPEFNAVFASAFSEGSSVSNERGLYFGVEMTPFKYWKLTAYADSYQFPWVKYDIDMPGNGKDFLLQADYSPSRRVDMFWRLKYEQNLKNLSGSDQTTTMILKNSKSSLRYQLVFNSGNFTFKSVFEGNLIKKGREVFTYGLAALQELSYSSQGFPLSFDVRYLIFDAVDYDNRIYTYEKDVLNSFSSPNFSGLGSRYYVNLKYSLTRNISVWLKFSQNIFADDRESIGSENELISGNKKTEIKCLIRWKFSNY